MKHPLATFLALVALALLVGIAGATPVDATGDRYDCPPDTIHVYKIDDLSGPTFTVPTPPAGWTVTGVSVKAGRDHYLYAPVTPGQTLDVKADTGHDVSHVHICKGKQWPTTTTSTTVAPTSTSTTSTTTPTPSSTSPSSTSTSVATTTAPTTSTSTSTSSPSSTSPATTSTTTQASTTSSTPETSAPPATSATTTGVTIPPATGPTSSLPWNGPLPATGDNARLLGVGAIALILLGGAALFVVRRPQ